jgi:hypothetical protein
LVAQVEGAGSAIIPAAGDRIYAPSVADTGVYSHHQVAGREFYYDQQGHLTLIKLECIEAPSQPVVVPARLADGPNGPQGA